MSLPARFRRPGSSLYAAAQMLFQPRAVVYNREDAAQSEDERLLSSCRSHSPKRHLKPSSSLCSMLLLHSLGVRPLYFDLFTFAEEACSYNAIFYKNFFENCHMKSCVYFLYLLPKLTLWDPAWADLREAQWPENTATSQLQSCEKESTPSSNSMVLHIRT